MIAARRPRAATMARKAASLEGSDDWTGDVDEVELSAERDNQPPGSL